jgi:hypothetical protein
MLLLSIAGSKILEVQVEFKERNAHSNFCENRAIGSKA